MSDRHQEAGPFSGPTGWIKEIGLAAQALTSCLALYLRILAGRARLDLSALAVALRQAGLAMVLPMTLASVSVGFILGQQISTTLSQFDLLVHFLLNIAYQIVMELVPVLVGILVASRAGVALAVRQATLTVTVELDGLLISGVHPIQLTLAPVLLAMLLMSFAFVVWGTLVTFAATGVWLWVGSAISPVQFGMILLDALTVGALVEALVKPQLFALLIAMIATVNGSTAGRNSEGIARAATRTMIGGIVAILVADLVYILLVRG